ncbi:MAG: thermonuclease family protein [Gemmatimonadetes bacterium]|nr:thermonuclease family protein [Gemmatimonadota bacterium]
MHRPGFALLALLALIAAPRAASGQPAAPPEACTVAFVVDGDTFNCRDGTTVRLLLVDAPEGGRFGDAARRALATLVPVDSTVRIETDREIRDGQGRLQGYVRLDDGRLVNDVLIRKGFAFFEPNPPNHRHAGRLRAAEDLARSEGLGVWSE